jgi:signal peptidase I
MEQEQQSQSYESLAHRHRHSVESVITLLEWLLVAFILALLFMIFAMQAFQIPTGSMAETLCGAHYRVRCCRCGYSFDIGNDAVSYGQPHCPNCDYVEPLSTIGQVKNGDRIFVLKSIYQFFEPKRWDVVVFKNPTRWSNRVRTPKIKYGNPCLKTSRIRPGTFRTKRFLHWRRTPGHGTPWFMCQTAPTISARFMDTMKAQGILLSRSSVT